MNSITIRGRSVSWPFGRHIWIGRQILSNRILSGIVLPGSLQAHTVGMLMPNGMHAIG